MTASRPRDASRTREALLSAARRRFAVDGYAATKVRDIADDAGVNVALINRYFGSKEGLFAACLGSAAEKVRGTADEVTHVEQIGSTIARTLAGADGERPDPLPLLMLLRTSGDPAAERLRLGQLRAFSERLAALVHGPGEPVDESLLLRAQIVVCLSLGMVLARSWPVGLEPLASAGEEDLAGPLSELVRALLTDS